MGDPIVRIDGTPAVYFVEFAHGKRLGLRHSLQIAIENWTSTGKESNGRCLDRILWVELRVVTRPTV